MTTPTAEQLADLSTRSIEQARVYALALLQADLPRYSVEERTDLLELMAQVHTLSTQVNECVATGDFEPVGRLYEAILLAVDDAIAVMSTGPKVDLP